MRNYFNLPAAVEECGGAVEEALCVSLLDVSVLKPESWIAMSPAFLLFLASSLLPIFLRTLIPGAHSPARMDTGMLEE